MEAVAMYVIVVVEIVLLGRLRYLGLHGHYPFFFAFVMADAAQTLAGRFVGVPLQSHGYLWFWAASESALVAFQALAAREACARIRASYPGIGRLGQGIAEWSFVIAIVACVASLFVDVSRANWHELGWSAGLVIRRAVATIIAFTMIGVAWLIRWAPAPVAPNVRRRWRTCAGRSPEERFDAKVWLSERDSMVSLGVPNHNLKTENAERSCCSIARSRFTEPYVRSIGYGRG